MPLETTECITISNNDCEYTDCMGFSLLRFIQLLGFCPKQLNQLGYSSYSSQISTGEIIEHINKHPKIFTSAEYYLNGGIKERNDWSIFVSNRKFLDYYRNDNKELFTSLENILKFFNGLIIWI